MYTYDLIVPKAAIDVLGHVNNVVYLDWVQIAASKHWNEATKVYFPEENHTDERLGIDTMAWVVIDHHIKYHAAAFKGDAILISTYVKVCNGATSVRHTEIRRKGEEKLLASAVTNWCLLKMPEGKPMRIPKEIIELF